MQGSSGKTEAHKRTEQHSPNKKTMHQLVMGSLQMGKTEKNK